METFGKLMAAILSFIILTVIRGFVLLKLWEWFIIPLFNQAPLKLFDAIGLLVVLYFIRVKYDKTAETKTTKDTAIEIMFVIFICAYCLAFGWIIHLLM